MSKAPPGSYPKQGSGYPTQPSAAFQQQQYNPAMAQQGYMYQQQYVPQRAVPPPQGHFGEPPPPYTAVPPPAYAQYTAAAPPGHVPYPRQSMPSQQYPQQPIAVHAQFDSGARFGPGTGATPNIPPPPPGYMPTSAQAAAAQGQNVVMTQRPEGWFSGGSDGGYSVW